MSFLLTSLSVAREAAPRDPAPWDAIGTSLLSQPLLYLALAGVCLVVVLRLLKRAMSPIGALIQAVAAAATVAFAAMIALAMLVAAAVATMR
ncbi:hypothetical protein [Actinoplanes utahensis]|uniref:Uncharacterized protein n=1 Tax=Actinoplanes utahensis TaxID=1869 RepID=A0A0A6UT26_ACTUT|nr:hypothetical protein [Actinoplanes utahensis]KHD79270.1 hypothetical protein MB27_01285 [Actinoplanes utahensis]GIF30297.1 hypothetical protein Aut01nite_32830 [Actinoplanes utahensis]